ncbi:TetR/AcrR family transcriptional regulator [Xylella taiwanensis]|uniref:TetR family transcriptional regulator n=1 Tax=Xylella taiwanensis TaxID=1444770 RepID=Z9JHG7_9GAMM|nr:TetR/AcrR family transcriptional regulator [Xylella taiwanensis]AXI83807.1 TetR family transcriptional regulator [Xylella taiwanensis]EWS77266.1 TetR family transcriptional regulator [Xylella taiwanensis]MCD8456910.1 TetR/AcrR family transcriptional regulator [Xylella taiwanensis]MCD8459322.1 TetR/AcrR family transcriptional regulator [Xylella taiwanensis]MCD8461807.1 TetR/AcrR family transcriptional regulator [Xylella taiwanensis]
MTHDTSQSPVPNRTTGTRSNRLTADNWIQAALDLIAEQGIDAVAVEPLARHLGVTKGSFYWHFPSRDALLQAALERWETIEQEQVFNSLKDVTDPTARLRALFQLVAHQIKPHAIYNKLLKTLDHPSVRPVVDRVSRRCLDYLVTSFRQVGMSYTHAQHRARLAYTAYVGFLQLSLPLQQPKEAREEFEAYVEHIIQTLIPYNIG